ncbi:hypothetical protein VPNG_06435 [Cytospora leucostoma]|uniref:Uncharacterized protein n=1 Tax=Cytospora leucostoma TaxID=1230097 RepID=A0A423WYU6_9PEZI|nr:hypothetical protein VPNG_06435 [Cytospora leucostoma]
MAFIFATTSELFSITTSLHLDGPLVKLVSWDLDDLCKESTLESIKLIGMHYNNSKLWIYYSDTVHIVQVVTLIIIHVGTYHIFRAGALLVHITCSAQHDVHHNERQHLFVYHIHGTKPIFFFTLALRFDSDDYLILEPDHICIHGPDDDYFNRLPYNKRHHFFDCHIHGSTPVFPLFTIFYRDFDSDNFLRLGSDLVLITYSIQRDVHHTARYHIVLGPDFFFRDPNDFQLSHSLYASGCDFISLIDFALIIFPFDVSVISPADFINMDTDQIFVRHLI